MKTEKEKMLAGEMYNSADPILVKNVKRQGAKSESTIRHWNLKEINGRNY